MNRLQADFLNKHLGDNTFESVTVQAVAEGCVIGPQAGAGLWFGLV